MTGTRTRRDGTFSLVAPNSPNFELVKVLQSKKISKHHKGAAAEREFVTVDLENYRGDDGTAIPMLYGFSGTSGELIVKGPNVTASEMFSLTIEAGRRWPGAIFVGYAFTSYDANFFLRDMPLKIARAISKGNPRYHNGYRIHWLRGKFFRITKGSRTGDRKQNITVTIYETVSWTGGAKLITAIQDHLGDVPDLIARGKDMRDEFEYSDLDTLVLPYWRIEQEYFRKLMERMRELILRANLALPRDWWGPSSLTAAAFKREGVKPHMRRDLPEEYMRACQRAYVGGRFEQPQGGFHDASVWQYDIISAYPSAQVGLWSWSDSELIYIPGDRLDRNKPFPSNWRFSCWDISFKFSGSAYAQEFAPMPYPLRDKRGAVYFPSRIDRGTYWAPEVAPFWRSPMLEIHGGWVIVPGNKRPFAWMYDYYERRQDLKRDGDPAQYPIKICLNAAYGKTAQRAGAKQDREGNWNLPAFHQLDWAGYITSTCRAKIMQVIGRVGWENVISIETDGIFLTQQLDSLDVTAGKLGAWEETRHDGMITLQNGVYWTRKGDVWSAGKVRGIRRGSPGVGAGDALEYLQRYSLSSEATCIGGEINMFHGAGHALGTEKFMTWSRERKEISFGGNGKRFHMWKPGLRPDRELVRLSNGEFLMAARGDADWFSYPHPLPWESYGGRTTSFREFLEDQIAMGQVIV